MAAPSPDGISGILQLRVLRDNANTSGEFSGADAYTGAAHLVFVDIHREEDTKGSSSEYVK